MALAVAEAYRVLRPGGLLLDIHPAAAPMRLELWTQRDRRASEPPADPAHYERRPLGDLASGSSQDAFAAATSALAAAVRAAQPGFQPAGRLEFDYRYVFDSLDELTGYLEENEELGLAGDGLLEQALLALQSALAPARLVLIQPIAATGLRKP